MMTVIRKSALAEDPGSVLFGRRPIPGDSKAEQTLFRTMLWDSKLS